jgi:uncharacterized membrane protein
MAGEGSSRRWLVPVLSAVFTSALGVAIAFAAAWKNNVIAWFVVAVVTALSAVIAYMLQPRGSPTATARTRTTTTESSSTITTTTSQPLMLKETVTITLPGGKITTTVREYFTEQAVSERIRQNLVEK